MTRPMSIQRVLVIAMAPVPDDLLERELGGLDPGTIELRMISPASRVSPLQWLTNEEDGARAEAEQIAEEGAEAAPSEASVEAGVGDTDPLQAAEDALRTFDADQVVVVVPPGDEASWLDRASMADGFERFGKPVRYLAGA